MRLSISLGPGPPKVNSSRCTMHGSRHNIQPGILQPADISSILQQQLGKWLHPIGIILLLYVSKPLESAPSHHIPNCIYTYSSSQFYAKLSLSQENITHTLDHSKLRPFHLRLKLCRVRTHGPCLAPVQQASSNECHLTACSLI